MGYRCRLQASIGGPSSATRRVKSRLPTAGWPSSGHVVGVRPAGPVTPPITWAPAFAAWISR